ncbi:MAG: hypothetical protein JKY67_08450 [Pseudomonadales bacterium]|nr:hypothetical protein [Pseudomonadales bacterium]
MITGKDVWAAMVDEEILHVAHHQCSFCCSMVYYFRVDDRLFFDPSCACASGGGPEERSWDEAADWINMQSDDAHKNDIKKRFGLLEVA